MLGTPQERHLPDAIGVLFQARVSSHAQSNRTALYDDARPFRELR